MKKIIFIILSIYIINLSIFSEKIVNSDELIETIENISNNVGPALPFAAASIGNNWDDAYIGTFPHFGLGLSFGVVLIPSESVDNLFNLFSIDRPDEMEVVDFMPLVLGSLDARIGSPFSRFDFGFKIGYIGNDPDDENQFSENDTDVLVDYKLAGIDVRFALVEQTLLLPDISVGIGLNYYKTDLRIKMSDDDYNDGEIALDLNGDNTYDVELGYPDLGMSLESTSVDFKAQISKTILVLVPFAGLGTSFGKSTIGGVLYSDTSEIDNISPNQSELETAGYKVEGNKIYYDKSYQGWTNRIYGGIGLSIAMFKLNIQLSLNPESEAIAFSANGRLQF